MSTSYVQYPVKGVPIYPSASNFPASAVNGSLAVAADTGGLYEFRTGTMTWVLLSDPAVTPLAITALTGDVTATGPGAAPATVAFVGGKSAASIATSVNDTQAATSANTPSTIVKRDGSGNFAAGTITASLTGHASLDLALTGGTMSGVIDMGSHKITSVTDPTAAQDAATKNYVDTHSAPISEPLSIHINGDNSPTADINWNNHSINGLVNLLPFADGSGNVGNRTTPLRFNAGRFKGAISVGESLGTATGGAEIDSYSVAGLDYGGLLSIGSFNSGQMEGYFQGGAQAGYQTVEIGYQDFSAAFYGAYWGASENIKSMGLFWVDLNDGIEHSLLTFDFTNAPSQVNLLFSTDGGGNIGATGANRPQNINFSGSLKGGYTATATNYSQVESDYIIGVTVTGAPRVITLLSPTTAGIGSILYIKDESGGAATNNISTAGFTVDGLASVSITQNYGVLRLYSNGSNWFSL